MAPAWAVLALDDSNDTWTTLAPYVPGAAPDGGVIVSELPGPRKLPGVRTLRPSVPSAMRAACWATPCDCISRTWLSRYWAAFCVCCDGGSGTETLDWAR